MKEMPPHPLRLARMQRNLTQAQLAEAIKVADTTIWRAENDYPINAECRQRLCSYFGLTPQELGLLERRKEKTPHTASPSVLLTRAEESPRESILFTEQQHQALGFYLQQQRTVMVDALVPGSVNLHVRDIVEQDSLFISPPWKDAQHVLHTTGLIFFLIDSLAAKKRVMLLGEAGQGKTTILKQVFTQMVDRFLKDVERTFPLPLYIPLREFTCSAERAIEMLWRYFQHEFPLSFEAFSAFVSNQQVVFLFDGFDEINGDLTQRAINERASSKVFTLPAILSCRGNFYECYLSMSVIQANYPQRVELQPLKLTESVTRYIIHFCTKKQNERIQQGVVTPEVIVKTIQESPALQDLAQRPLLLVKMLDIFTESQGISRDKWNTAELYQRYTEKWLKNEAAKPDSVLRWYEKAALIQEVAWSTYTVKALIAPTRKLNENTTFTRRDLSYILERLAARYQPIPFSQLIDDICFRTFLIANTDDTYYFIHESFQEYYVASYIFEYMKSREQTAETVAHVLQGIFPAEVTNLLRAMLNAKNFLASDRERVVDTLIKVYQQNSAENNYSARIRQNASTYLAFLGTPKAVQFLEEAFEQEADKWVQRGMMIGLALSCNRGDILDRYVDIIRTDSDAASINIGYHLVYYGDQIPEERYYDRGKIECDKAVRAIFRHLRNESYKNGWTLDLLTLRMLLERRDMTILTSDEQYLPFLKEFLSRDHQQQSSIFHQEKRLLQEILERHRKISV